jgi:hydrogenase small subunit
MTAADLGLLGKALADPSSPVVLWLLGSACTGCSISLLNRISDRVGEPGTVEDLCADSIRLVFHPTLMASAGETAVAALRRIQEREAYVLVVEGAVPMAFGGHACVAYSYRGEEVTFQRAVQEAASRAARILCVGTCAAFGGISAAGNNPTQAISVSQLTGRPVINVSGCPANPDWVIWSIVQLLLGREPALDGDQRPRALYETGFTGAAEPALIHDKCPRNPDNHAVPLAKGLGERGHCLENLGCRGPFTKARCEDGWNGVGGARAPHPHPAHWCIGVNAPCHGCVEKSFPGPQSLYEPYLP